jgi:hypothetical protein
MLDKAGQIGKAGQGTYVRLTKAGQGKADTIG